MARATRRGLCRYEVSPVDPLVIAGVLVLVAVCGLVASHVPFARRATRSADPERRAAVLEMTIVSRYFAARSVTL